MLNKSAIKFPKKILYFSILVILTALVSTNITCDKKHVGKPKVFNFAILNLDYPGLERVRELTDTVDFENAKEELHRYFTKRQVRKYVQHQSRQK